MKRTRLLLLIVLLSMTTLIVVTYTAYSPYPHGNGIPFNRKMNGIWLAHRWFTGDYKENEVSELVLRLKENDIKYIFLHAGPLKTDGEIPAYSLKTVRYFIRAVKVWAPDIVVLAWLGGLNKEFKGNLDIGQNEVILRIGNVSRELVDTGFDGIHLNIEPLRDGDRNFIRLLSSIKKMIGSEKILSVASMKWRGIRIPHIWHDKWFWGTEYYKDVAKEVDQVVTMLYDTSIPLKKAYVWYVKNQTRNILNTIAKSGNLQCEVLIGLPAYDKKTRVHNPDVENIENGLYGVIAVLEKGNQKAGFAGVAIYAHWVIDEKEWMAYRRLWTGR